MQSDTNSVLCEENSTDEALCYSVNAICEVSSGCYKITPSAGPSFFFRDYYLSTIKIDEIVCGRSFNNIEFNEIMNAGLAYNVERHALDYLNRCEQCKSGLILKLQKKGFDLLSINMALDYLIDKNYLSDYRFSVSWLRNRRITNSEGKNKLYMMLLAKGISSNIAKEALQEFFSEFSEEEMLQKAFAKCQRKKIPEEKIREKLIYYGFSNEMIKNYLANK